MKIFRFMSIEEFEKYLNNETLKNETVQGGKTNSIGFCFLNLEDHAPKDALHFLSGIVSFDICAVFEVDEKLLNKTWGVYASPIKKIEDDLAYLINIFNGFHETFKTPEYCTTTYNKKDFRLVKYTTNIWGQYDLQKNQRELLWIDGGEV